MEKNIYKKIKPDHDRLVDFEIFDYLDRDKIRSNIYEEIKELISTHNIKEPVLDDLCFIYNLFIRAELEEEWVRGENIFQQDYINDLKNIGKYIIPKLLKEIEEQVRKYDTLPIEKFSFEEELLLKDYIDIIPPIDHINFIGRTNKTVLTVHNKELIKDLITKLLQLTYVYIDLGDSDFNKSLKIRTKIIRKKIIFQFYNYLNKYIPSLKESQEVKIYSRQLKFIAGFLYLTGFTFEVAGQIIQNESDFEIDLPDIIIQIRNWIERGHRGL